MTKNMGTTDKVIRIIVAAIIAILYFTHVITGTTATVALVVAAIFVATSFIGYCPLYSPFKINTNK